MPEFDFGLPDLTDDASVSAKPARPAPRVRIKSTKENIVLAIPDLHCPFQHPDALEFIKHVRDRFHVTEVICLGDEIDAHAFSRWPKDPDGMGPGQELKAAIEALIPWYLSLIHI